MISLQCHANGYVWDRSPIPPLPPQAKQSRKLLLWERVLVIKSESKSKSESFTHRLLFESMLLVEALYSNQEQITSVVWLYHQKRNIAVLERPLSIRLLTKRPNNSTNPLRILPILYEYSITSNDDGFVQTRNLVLLGFQMPEGFIRPDLDRLLHMIQTHSLRVRCPPI